MHDEVLEIVSSDGAFARMVSRGELTRCPTRGNGRVRWARLEACPQGCSSVPRSRCTMSADGRLARDVMLGLSKTCRKLRLSFFAYLWDRLGLNTDQPKIPPLAVLVIQA